jgi:hypothetical protein
MPNSDGSFRIRLSSGHPEPFCPLPHLPRVSLPSDFGPTPARITKHAAEQFNMPGDRATRNPVVAAPSLRASIPGWRSFCLAPCLERAVLKRISIRISRKLRDGCQPRPEQACRACNRGDGARLEICNNEPHYRCQDNDSRLFIPPERLFRVRPSSSEDLSPVIAHNSYLPQFELRLLCPPAGSAGSRDLDGFARPRARATPRPRREAH